MKQTSMSYMTALVGALLADQVCHAIPTSMDITSIAARGDAVLAPGPYGKNNGPEIQDLATATGDYSGDYMKVSKGGQEAAKYSFDLMWYNRMLFGFLKCEQAWVESWFPSADEMEKLKESNQLHDDNTVFLRYNEIDLKRHPVIVSRGWANEVFSRVSEATSASFSPWWSWAALQGAYEDQPEELQMADIVMAISGEKLVPVKVENKDDYWKTLVDGHKTPIWIDTGGIWSIVMSTQGEGPADGSLMTARVLGGRVFDVPESFPKLKESISDVYILEGMPTFTKGQERKGEIAY